MPAIRYEVAASVSTEAVATLFQKSGIHRPYSDLPRIQMMLQHADLIVTAWDREALVGIARALTDWCYCCYLSDLAVDWNYQRSGIGAALIAEVQRAIGDSVTLVLVSAPEAGVLDHRDSLGEWSLEGLDGVGRL